VGNKEDGVGALLFPKALCELTNLFGMGGLPEWSFAVQAPTILSMWGPCGLVGRLDLS
jgi:hypothetical protein